MKRCFFMLYLLLIALPVQAQDDDYFPRLFNPQVTDAVQIVSSRPQVAYSTDSFVVWNGTTWDEYELPGLIPPDSVNRGQWESDGTYQITYWDKDLASYMPVPSDHGWRINPDTGEIFPLPSICGGFVPNDLNAWLPYPFDDPPFTRLCNSTTGEFSSIFPDDINPYTESEVFNHTSPLSPDRAWLIEVSESEALNAYHFATGQRTHLGQLQSLEYQCTEARHLDYRLRWISNTQFYLEQHGYCDGIFVLYSGDLTQTDSLTLLMSANHPVILDHGSYFWWEYDANPDLPPMPDIMTPQQFAQDCAIREYNSETDNFYLRFIPGVCGLTLAIPDGSGDYLFYPYPFGIGLGDVLRFNPRTGAVHTILPDDHDWFWEISPDGHYLSLTLRHNWNPEIGILDLQTGTIVYTGIKIGEKTDSTWQSWNPDSRHALVQNNGRSGILNAETGEIIDIAPSSWGPDTEWLDDETLRVKMDYHAYDEDRWLRQSAEWVIHIQVP